MAPAVVSRALAGLIAVTFSLTALADFKSAVEAERRGDYRSAYQEFLSLAQRGDRASQYNVAQMTAAGRGTAQDFRKAAAWFEKAAAQGDGESARILGGMHFNGDGFPRDPAKAMQWWEKAVKLRDGLAAYNIAGLYAAGVGVPASPERMLDYLERSARLGCGDAQVRIAHMYANNELVRRDLAVAYVWASMATKSRIDQQRYKEALPVLLADLERLLSKNERIRADAMLSGQPDPALPTR